MQYHAIPCNTMQYNAIPCNTMQYHAIPCNTMQYHAIQCNTMQYNAMSCYTMQYHASLITADGAYHCPVGSIMAMFGSKTLCFYPILVYFQPLVVHFWLLLVHHYPHMMQKHHFQPLFVKVYRVQGGTLSSKGGVCTLNSARFLGKNGGGY